MKGWPEIEVRLVTTADDVGEFMTWLDDHAGEAIAIDTETTGLKWWTHSFTRLVQFGVLDSGWAIPTSWWGKVIEAALEKLIGWGTPIVMHNASFDMHALETMDYPLPDWSNVYDTAILMRLHRSDLPAGLKSKHTAELLGGNWIFNGQQWLGSEAKRLGLKGNDKWRYMPVDNPAYWAYGIADTCLTRMVFDELLPTLEDFRPQFDREMHYMAIMYRAEKRGILVDNKYTTALRSTMEHDIERDLLWLQSNGLENPNSNKQLAALLEHDYGFVPWEFTATGDPKLDKHVLKVLAKVGGMTGEVVQTLVRYKRNVKWLGAYVDTFLNEQDRHGMVHPSINTMAARTGRSSIQNPALQTLPGGQGLIRRCLLPQPGCVWVSIDYSNQEPRTLAHYGQSPELLAYFTEGDGRGSVHDFVAAKMFGPDYSKEQRSIAKIMGLSRSYGAGAAKMAEASGRPQAEIEMFLPIYDELMGLTHLNNVINEAAYDRMPTPYIVTSGGRRVYADEDKTYTLVNFLMQGSGADGLKQAAVGLDRAGLADYINVPVHDEMTFSFPKDEVEEASHEAARIMELEASEGMSLGFPVDIDGPAKSWGHIYSPEMA